MDGGEKEQCFLMHGDPVYRLGAEAVETGVKGLLVSFLSCWICLKAWPHKAHIMIITNNSCYENIVTVISTSPV